MDRYISPKFNVNSFDGIRENGVYGGTTDNDRRMTDARVMTAALLCSSTKQS